MSLDVFMDKAANSSLSVDLLIITLLSSLSGRVSSISAMCAIGRGTLFARYSSRRPSIAPPGWKHVSSVWPSRPQFEHRERVPRVFNGVTRGGEMAGTAALETDWEGGAKEGTPGKGRRGPGFMMRFRCMLLS